MLFKKEPKQPTTRIPRIVKMSTPELIEWYNSVLVANGIAFDEWRYKTGEESEVASSLKVLNDIWEELMDRRS